MTFSEKSTPNYWEARSQPYLNSPDMWLAVSATGLPPSAARIINRLEEQGVNRLAVHLPAHERSIDVGCGYGRWFPITSRDRIVLGLDFTPSLVRHAYSRAPGQVAVADLRHLPISPGSVGSAYSVKVLQFLPPEHKGPAIQQIFDCVRPGGVVVLFEQIVDCRPATWISLAEQAGGRLYLWLPNQQTPLDRVFMAAVGLILRPIRKSRPASDTDGPQRLQEHMPKLARLHGWLRSLSLSMSIALEPLALRVLPRRWAENGIFCFEKIG